MPLLDSLISPISTIIDKVIPDPEAGTAPNWNCSSKKARAK